MKEKQVFNIATGINKDNFVSIQSFERRPHPPTTSRGFKGSGRSRALQAPE
jgi:hypothetical protein